MDQQSNTNSPVFYSPLNTEEPTTDCTDYFTSPLNDFCTTPYDVFDFTNICGTTSMISDDDPNPFGHDVSEFVKSEQDSNPICHGFLPGLIAKPDLSTFDSINNDDLFNQHSSPAASLHSGLLVSNQDSNTAEKIKNNDSDPLFYTTLPNANQVMFQPLNNPLSSSSLFLSTLQPLACLDANPKAVHSSDIFGSGSSGSGSSTAPTGRRKNCKRKKEEMEESESKSNSNSNNNCNNYNNVSNVSSNEEGWGVEEEARKQQRLMKNRASAQKSRLKKRQETEAIEKRNEELEGQNATLEQEKGILLEEWDNMFKTLNQHSSNLTPQFLQEFSLANRRVQAMKSPASLTTPFPNFSSYFKM